MALSKLQPANMQRFASWCAKHCTFSQPKSELLRHRGTLTLMKEQGRLFVPCLGVALSRRLSCILFGQLSMPATLWEQYILTPGP